VAVEIFETPISGLIEIQPKVWGDSRGFFIETFQKELYSEIGISIPFVQDNLSCSAYGVIRGLHFQVKKPQGKLVTCLNGQVLDVVVDLRVDSKTRGHSYSMILDSEKRNQLWIPPGFAHGFSVLSKGADFFYKCTDFYAPGDEAGIIWNDSDLGIDWRIRSPQVSEKDMNLRTLREVLGSEH
jgi:dTDP-4-dehydrorhamnose 3,5-epimerase